MFQISQALNCIFIRRVAGELKTTDTLDRNNKASLDQCAGSIDLVEHRERLGGKRLSVSAFKPGLRPAFVTGDRLCMKTPVGWVFVFCSAIGTHFEPAHCRVRTVVRNILNDRKSRAAMCAVCERVTKASGEGIERFRFARLTTRCVRHNTRMDFSSFTFGNLEIQKVSGQLDFRSLDVVDP